MNELKAPEQNKALGRIAEILRMAEQNRSAEFLPESLNVFGLFGDLFLPSAKTVEKMSYGDPLFRMAPSGTGSRIPMTTDKEYLADVAGMVPIAAPAAKPSARGAQELIRQIQTEPPVGAISPEIAAKVLPQTKVVDKAAKQPKDLYKLFDEESKFPMSESVETIKDNWIGGVSGIGNRDLAYELADVIGGPKYIKNVQNIVKKNLGNKFQAYRLMSKDEAEELTSGSHSQLASFTLDENIAKSFANIAAYRNIPKEDLVIVSLPITPKHIMMLGKKSEKELVVDTGVGYSLDEIKISPVSDPSFEDVFTNSLLQDSTK